MFDDIENCLKSTGSDLFYLSDFNNTPIILSRNLNITAEAKNNLKLQAEVTSVNRLSNLYGWQKS